MTKFKAVGYCPSREIASQGAMKEEVKEMLGQRACYMHYAGNDIASTGCYITKVLMSTDSLAMDVATLLNKMVSNVPIHDTGRKIILHDVSAPQNMPYVESKGGITYCLSPNAESRGITLFQNSEFLVWVRSNLMFTEMYICEQPQR